MNMTDKMIVKVVIICLLQLAVTQQNDRESRKLFGGYKITPRFCKPTRRMDSISRPGPNICMFNHECASRQGVVVGACMDGFLFGACCNLPGETPGELIETDQVTPALPENDVEIKTTKEPNVNIMSNGFTELTLTTGGDNNNVVHIGGRPTEFVSSGITHPTSEETYLLNNENNEIQPIDWNYPQKTTQTTERGNTMRDESTSPYGVTSPLIQISISHSPTTASYFQKPMFRPKPTTNKPEDDKYILVPTITHQKPNKTQELESIVNILQMLNDSSTSNPLLSSYGPSTALSNRFQTTKKPLSTSYVYSTSIPKRPTTKVPNTLSTSYVSSTAPPPKRTTLKKPSSSQSTAKPSKRPSTTAKPSTKPNTTNKKPKPPQTSYVFSSIPTRRPIQSSVQTANVVGPSFSVTTPTKAPYATSTYKPTVSSTYRPTVSSSYKPTVSSSYRPTSSSYRPTSTSRPTVTYKPTVSYKPTGSVSYKPSTSYRPSDSSYRPTSSSYRPANTPSSTPNIILIAPVTSEPEEVTNPPPPKPVTQLTINNIVTATNNYHYSTSRPSPTIHITPKPPLLVNSGGYIIPVSSTEYSPDIDLESSPNNDLINFPPVRNPNLNISASLASIDEDPDFTTPGFVEDDKLDKKVATFVNKIVLSLQDPFNELKDIVYNKNKTTTTTKKPTSNRKPTKATPKPTSQKPPRTGTTRPSTSRPNSTKSTTRKPTSKRPTVTTKKPVPTTTRKPKPTKKVTTTPPPIEEEDEYEEDSPELLDYRRHCGVRPLMKSGRIVGGKGATFGEWPWQVLVRESTWLGLFTKNKCGGVLISQNYVVTAAHCQPGFLASLVAVFGEYDISGDLEKKRSMSKNVKRVIVHRQYDAATFENDLALLELESPVQYDQHIVPICLPSPEEDFTGRMATVTGWGRLKYAGGVPSVLQEVQVPIMENHVCQEMFRTAGHNKIILDSFLCAGYANGQKDSCEGDSGGPLVLQRADGRWELAGTVSHGIKCAAPYLPGVYMRTTFFKPWLESITGIH